MSDEGGLGACGAYGCPLHGSISVDGGKWFCAFHARRPHFEFDKITAVLQKESTLVAEMLKGRQIIASPKAHTAAEIETLALNQAEALISMGIEPDMTMFDEKEDKAWLVEYRGFINSLARILNSKVQKAVEV